MEPASCPPYKLPTLQYLPSHLQRRHARHPQHQLGARRVAPLGCPHLGRRKRHLHQRQPACREEQLPVFVNLDGTAIGTRMRSGAGRRAAAGNRCRRGAGGTGPRGSAGAAPCPARSAHLGLSRWVMNLPAGSVITHCLSSLSPGGREQRHRRSCLGTCCPLCQRPMCLHSLPPDPPVAVIRAFSRKIPLQDFTG